MMAGTGRQHRESPLDPLTLMARVKDGTAALEASRGASRKETK